MSQQNQFNQPNNSQESRQNFQPEKIENKNVSAVWVTILIAVFTITTICLVGFIIYRNIVSKPSESNGEVFVPTDKAVYFGNGWEGKYFFVNANTEEVKTIIPSGYELVGQHNYDLFPNFFILRKNDDLFSYSLINKSLNKVPIEPLKKSEKVMLYPSISDKSEFYLKINDTKETRVMYGYDIIGSRKYFLNADTNQVQAADNINLPDIYDFSVCSEYDSKYSRFFIWPCGEGIGSSIPLTVYNLVTKTQKEVVTFQDFGVNENLELVRVEYNNGYFLTIPKEDEFSKIIIVNPTKDINKEVFTVSEKVIKKLKKIPIYSALLVKEKNTIVIGGDDFILLLRFNNNNQIVDSSFIFHQGLYANFIFPHAGKIYYQLGRRNLIEVVNLDNWQIEKPISMKGSEEITLILFE